MANKIQPVRGMNDIIPPETAWWQYVQSIFQTVFHQYGYQEIRFPIVEKTELFKRAVGEVTDIVEKEMYTFIDRSEESLSLRPEGTACCVRAVLEHEMLYNQTQRLWYTGPFFRHERPQKGRYRQFHQSSAETFGIATPDIDAELIIMTATLLKRLHLAENAELQINSLGVASSRALYREKLVAYLQEHKNELDAESVIRLEKNPLRVLDSKNPALATIIANAPKLLDHLDEESKAHFEQLQLYLKAAGIPFKVNPYLVRGLDYYTKTVFEWVTTDLGAQGTICAGGRYDGLVEQLGGKPTPAVGFSLGIERTILLLQTKFAECPLNTASDVFLMTDSPASFTAGLNLANLLREAGLSVTLHCGGGSLKNQFKKADKSGAAFGVIIGEQELQTQTASLKSLREFEPQQTLNYAELIAQLKAKLDAR